jgi:hypothetical protein
MGAGGKHLTEHRDIGVFTDFNGGAQAGKAGPNNNGVKLMFHKLPHFQLLK